MTDSTNNQTALASAASSFIEHGRSIGWADNTVAHYRHYLGVALPFLIRRGCTRPADVTPADLDALMRHILEAGRSKRSRVHFARLLKQVFGWWHANGRLVVDPTLAMSLPDDGDDDLLEPPLSVGDVRALFESLPRRSVIDLRNVCLLELLYGYGLRIGEVIALRTRDIDLANRVVTIFKSKHGQDRMLPLMGTAQAAVEDYMAVRRSMLKGPDGGTLLLSQYGKPLVRGSVYAYFDELNRQRGSDARHLRPHLFRHSIAVHLLRGGADVRYVQQFLGHASLDTTKTYLRLVPGRLKEDYDRAMPDIAVGLSGSHLST